MLFDINGNIYALAYLNNHNMPHNNPYCILKFRTAVLVKAPGGQN